MKRIPKSELLVVLVLFFVIGSNYAAFAQSPPCSYEPCPYTGSQRFKPGDLVEATYLGAWKNAVVVSGYRDNGFGGVYEIRFEGDRSSENISAKWVRPRKASAPAVRSGNGPINNNTAPTNSNAASWPGQKYRVGNRVIYTDGNVLWSGPGQIIAVDTEKRQYTVRDLKDQSWKYIYACFAVSDPKQIDNSFYIGKWDVYITGATSTFTHNGKVYRRFSGGAQLPPLEVKADGTYVWRLSARETIRGRWEDRKGVPGITLLGAIGGEDYTLYEKTEAFATTARTRDEIGITHLPSGTGYYMAYRIGENKSCVLSGRSFR